MWPVPSVTLITLMTRGEQILRTVILNWINFSWWMVCTSSMISTGPSFFRGIQNEMNNADLHSNSIRGTYVQTCFTTLACHESHIVSVAFGIQWRAPEEYSYKPETEKIDVWSLGNVLYYLLTRREPFDKYNDDEIPVHVMEGNVPDIKDATILNSTHPFDMTLLKVVKMCWEYDPEKRPSSRQVASILQEALNKLNWVQAGRLRFSSRDKARSCNIYVLASDAANHRVTCFATIWNTGETNAMGMSIWMNLSTAKLVVICTLMARCVFEILSVGHSAQVCFTQCRLFKRTAGSVHCWSR